MTKVSPDSNPDTPALRVRSLSKRYGGAIALEPLDLDVALGERITLMAARQNCSRAVASTCCQRPSCSGRPPTLWWLLIVCAF